MMWTYSFLFYILFRMNNMRIKTQDESAHCKYAKQQKVYSCQKYTHQWLQSQQNNIYQPAVIYIIQFFYKQIQDRKIFFQIVPQIQLGPKHTHKHTYTWVGKLKSHQNTKSSRYCFAYGVLSYPAVPHRREQCCFLSAACRYMLVEREKRLSQLRPLKQFLFL